MTETRPDAITALADMQARMRALVASLDNADCRAQFHPQVSPVGWHLGHATFIENLWIRETLLGDDAETAATRDLYLPQNSEQCFRGDRLPPKETLLDRCSALQRDNLSLLSTLLTDPPAAFVGHRLVCDGYLAKFLAQHHAMHFETMQMGLTARRLQKLQRGEHYSPTKRLDPCPPRIEPIIFDGGEVEIGGEGAWCFDNELPRHRETLHPFSLNATPASNAEFLGFIESGGYDNLSLWDDAGRQWLEKSGVRAPYHWLQDTAGAWYGADGDGTHDLDAAAPVSGLSLHEALAFAHYAGGRLPHESEWETAHCQNPARVLPNDRAWEWCANLLRPYPGFEAFPYKEYSAPWFHNRHYVLRGHSRHTPAVLHRPTFRNFHTADKRHIFTGVRVALD